MAYLKVLSQHLYGLRKVTEYLSWGRESKRRPPEYQAGTPTITSWPSVRHISYEPTSEALCSFAYFNMPTEIPVTRKT